MCKKKLLLPPTPPHIKAMKTQPTLIGAKVVVVATLMELIITGRSREFINSKMKKIR